MSKGSIENEIEYVAMPTTGIDKGESVQSVKTDWTLSFCYGNSLFYRERYPVKKALASSIEQSEILLRILNIKQIKMGCELPF